MKFLILKTKDPHLNLAIEEYLFSSCDDDIFMLWQNEPTVVIGKNQNAYAEINQDFLKENNIHIARRITGGGAVYHDLGNVNYTFISGMHDGKGIDFEHFTAPIIDALATLGVSASLSGRNDLMTDGKKFSGNAQHSAHGRTLHHGTLLFDSDLEFLSSALKVDEEKIRSKAIKSTRARVTNLKPLISEECDTQKFISLIAEYVQKKYDAELIDAPSSPEIDALYKRNSSSEWLFPESGLRANYTLIKKKRYPFGIVEAYLNMSNERIKNIRIQGDFFGVRPIEELENILEDTLLKDIPQKISDINIEDYIFGMTPSLFNEHIASE